MVRLPFQKILFYVGTALIRPFCFRRSTLDVFRPPPPLRKRSMVVTESRRKIAVSAVVRGTWVDEPWEQCFAFFSEFGLNQLPQAV